MLGRAARCEAVQVAAAREVETSEHRRDMACLFMPLISPSRDYIRMIMIHSDSCRDFLSLPPTHLQGQGNAKGVKV